jgi:protein-S-isoprenylcysteine O-methyltransferase Ste14
MRTLTNLAGIALIAAVCGGLIAFDVGQPAWIVIALGGVLGIVLLVWLGRRLLDAQPTVERAVWVTTFIHYGVLTLLGAAVIGAVRVGMASPEWVIPLPSEVGLTLMLASGALALLAVLNLAARGLGAPFAIALSRQLAMDWMYAWTRNPMILSALAFLIAVGLWLRSSLFMLWVIAAAIPAVLVFLKVFEERELEIRFGARYLEYKARTPMLWPRPPRASGSREAPGNRHV